MGFGLGLLAQAQSFNLRNLRRYFLQVSPALGLLREPQVAHINYFEVRVFYVTAVLGMHSQVWLKVGMCIFPLHQTENRILK